MAVCFKNIKKMFAGNIYTDRAMRILYSTDASVYKELPLAVALPKNENDVKLLIDFALKNNTSLLFRTAGTSLAGQCVGSGIVVDCSKYFTKIIEVNKEEQWVKVQPGVILSELNAFLKPLGLFFGPETSTANRCMIGGMVSNNSAGLHSLKYGSTRDHLLEIKTILSDGSEAIFGTISKIQFEEKLKGNSLESNIYRHIWKILSNDKNRKQIENEFPLKSIMRRNTGYAIDLLMDKRPFVSTGKAFNFCSLLAGSEGTLAFFSEIKLNLVPLPPSETGLVCVHVNSVEEALQVNLIALQYKPAAVELMDRTILSLSKSNILQQSNHFFVKGDPGAIVFVEFSHNTKEEIKALADAMQRQLEQNGLGYHFPVLYGSEINKAWDLRKAGLGVLSNMVGDAKPTAFIEDAALDVNVLPDYIRELKTILSNMNLNVVFFAHIGSGEIHIRPVINLKTSEGQKLFREVGDKISTLVKKYKGSLSGEHGDGRVRGEFIRKILGEYNYELLRQVKEVWDSKNIFNPGKIIDAPAMNISLRYEADKAIPMTETVFDFSDSLGLLRAVERCNGSADCRKTSKTGGIMCPSYMATLDETNTTRARANILREFLSNSQKSNHFSHAEIYEVMKQCLSCKGCKSECPSNVDMAMLKSEFLQHYYDDHSTPLITKFFANITKINSIASHIPSFYNALTKGVSGALIKHAIGFAPQRTMPLLKKFTLRNWIKKNQHELKPIVSKGFVYFFVDEFNNYYDVEIEIKAIKLLVKFGFEVKVISHAESGRAFISKGYLRRAKQCAEKNIRVFKNIISDKNPLIGLEPSTILTFRDEYISLSLPENKIDAQNLAKNCFLFEEFITLQIEAGTIDKSIFTEDKKNIKLHGHCHQKSIASVEPTKKMLSLPTNYRVETIPSGCCGMAGSFGYEKSNYELSMKIGELILFPEIRKSSDDILIVANGTSCRQQILDGTGKTSYHPVEVLFDAVKIEK